MSSPTEVLYQLHSRFQPIDYGYLLQRCRQMIDSRPARFLFPVALLPVPAWCQNPCFQCEYPRGQLSWTDSPGAAIGGSYPWIWTGRPLPVGLFPLFGVMTHGGQACFYRRPASHVFSVQGCDVPGCQAFRDPPYDHTALPTAENNTRVGLARSMASAGARACNGGLGAEPPAGFRGKAPGGVHGGKAP